MNTVNPVIDVPTPRTVLVWDPLVRIFHWSLATFFLVAYLTEDDLQTVHTYAGYAVFMLILFRLAWGVIGTRHARFADFVTGPRELVRYLGRMLAGRAPRYVGHNPAGAAMILALLTTLLVTTGSGMVMLGAEGAGPLAGVVDPALAGEWLEDVHEFFANLTLLLVVLHVAGVVASSLAHRENLVGAMFTGRKHDQ